MHQRDNPEGLSDPALVAAVWRVQRLVADCAPLAETYGAVLHGAVGLVGGDSGSVRMLDPADPSWTVAVAVHGAAGMGERWRERSPISEGISGRVISTGEMAVVDDYHGAMAGSQLAPPGTQAIIGVPLLERGRAVGSLVVGYADVGRSWTEREQALMREYGRHVSAALAVAGARHSAEQAFTDPLTGLGNRALLLDRLDYELVRADRGGEPVTVLFLDLDRFKLVNDSLGHLVGDRLLIAVAERLRRCVRGGDTCARLGGDEFAVLLAGRSQPEAVAERMIEALQQRFEIGGQELFVGVSVGIASGREGADTLLRHADVAMYHAKRAGGGRHRRFERSMQAEVVSRLDLTTELRGAVDRGQLELHYQPLYDLRSGGIAAFEALVRWRHPTRGLVAPLDFISVAEETGLIVAVGRWVLEQACAQLAAWRRHVPLALSINVSPRELQEARYAAAVGDAVNGAFPPSALILEVTESSPLHSAPGALDSLRAASELGFRVALDDFGTGYSSLVDLAHLPVDLLKIARPFLDEPDLLAGVIGLARGLGLTTVAEGVERPEQHARLLELGCDLGQGYLLSPPLPAA